MPDSRVEPPHQASPQDDAVLKIIRFDDIHDSVPDLPPLRLDQVRERRGRRLDELGHDQPGFARGDAAVALEAMSSCAVAVEAIEVVRVTNDRPEYTIQRWRCERGMGEPPAQYCRRSLKLAEDFLAAYPDPGDGSIVYVLCPASEGKSRAA